MPFSISETELVMTSSPSYASELVGLANVTTSANGRIVDTSFYTHVQVDGILIVDKHLIVNQIRYMNNDATDELRLGLNASSAVSQPGQISSVLNNVPYDLTTSGPAGGSNTGAPIIFRARNSVLDLGKSRFGYFDNGPLYDTDNCIITGEPNSQTGLRVGSTATNTTFVNIAALTLFGTPADVSGLVIQPTTAVPSPTIQTTGNPNTDINITKVQSPDYGIQRQSKLVMIDCSTDLGVAFGYQTEVNIQGRSYFKFKKTISTRAAGPNANAGTTRYVFGGDDSLLASTALSASGELSEVIQWGYIDGVQFPWYIAQGRVSVSQINTNTGLSPTGELPHVDGEYKLPLTVAHVSYGGALNITSGITFDVSTDEYREDYTLLPILANDVSITETTKATVDAYTTLETPHKFYDYAKSYLVDNYGGETATIVSRSGNEIDAGSYNVTIDATAASVFAFDGTTITIKASTYTGDMTTTGVITLANGAVFIGTRTDANGTIAPPSTVSITNITAGSRLQIYNVTTSTEVVNEVVSGTSYSATYVNGTGYTTGDTVRVRLTYTDNTPSAKLPYSAQAVVGSTGWSILAAQEDDTVYASLGVDGATVTEFAPDYPNVQVDINDPDGSTRVDRLYAWFVHTQSTQDGIANWFGGVVPEDDANFRVVTSVLDLKIDNVSASGVTFTDGRRLYRDDGASPLVGSTSGGGSITFFAGKVYTSVVTTADGVITGDIADLSSELSEIKRNQTLAQNSITILRKMVKK